MSWRLEIKEEAKKDIVEAAHWYQQKSLGLDIKFIQYLEDTFHIILVNPKTFKRVYKNFRQAALKKFPFVVVYETEEDTIIIYSVFHTKQNPVKKIKRLKK
jgi:plasmid stabilization system protein ParE